MNEKEFDSSINEYEEVNKPNGYIKQLQWDMAIGLQEVDNLKPSKHLEKLLPSICRSQEVNIERDVLNGYSSDRWYRLSWLSYCS